MGVEELSRALNRELHDAPRRAPRGYPELSQSVATVLVSESPKHAFDAHPDLGGEQRKATKEMDLGSVVHAMILGKGAQFEVVEGGHKDWKKKDAQEQRDALRAEGKIALLEREHERALTVTDIVAEKLRARGIVFDGVVERRIRWTEQSRDGAIVHCAGTLDHAQKTNAGLIIDDLKSSKSAHPEQFQRSMMRFGYDIQWAAYTRGGDQAYKANGRVDMRFIVFEVTRPYCVTIARPAGTMRALGNLRWQRAVDAWAKCVRDNDWPEYCTGAVEIEAPNWAIMREGEELDCD